MTAHILVVDDVPANVKLLEAKLTAEYYDVFTATNGFEAIDMARSHRPDLILLDVMMPEMDGFEACRRIKEDPELSHIPIVMVTALSEMSDRVRGLEAGADDFITKPINDTALFARVKSLIRMKLLLDELRLREKTGLQIGVDTAQAVLGSDVSGSRIVLINDDIAESKQLTTHLEKQYDVLVIEDSESARNYLVKKSREVDLIIVNTIVADVDGLRITAQIRKNDTLRHVPIILQVDDEEKELMLKGLEMGVNDYLVNPVDANEMIARVRTQIRRKKYQDALRASYENSMSMAFTDVLTGVYNRLYLNTHLKNMIESAVKNRKPLSLLMMDMDHFKSVNDTYGHDVGDEVLKTLGQVLISSSRSTDLAARMGGEEFVMLMPETDFNAAYESADRIRRAVENKEFKVSHEIGVLRKTVSIGVSSLQVGDTPETLFKRADLAVYEAKHAGRNCVMPVPAHKQHLLPMSGVRGIATVSRTFMSDISTHVTAAAKKPDIDMDF